MKDINEAVAKIEKEFSLFNWKAGEIELWPSLKILLLTSNLDLTARSYSAIELVKMAITCLLSYLRIYLSPPKNNYIHFGDGYFKNSVINNKTYLPQYTPYQEEFLKQGVTGVYLERLYSTKNVNGPHFGVDFFIFFAKILSKFLSPKNLELPKYEQVILKLESIGLDTKELSRGKIQELAIFFEIMAKFYIFLLKRVKPKFVTFRCFYIRAKFPLIYTCKKMGIKTVDIQHGLQASNMAYKDWQYSYNLLPDYFWVWSDEEKANIESWGGNAILGGNLMLENFKKLDAKENIESKKVLETLIPSNVKVILITLQWGLQDYSFIKKYLNLGDDYFFLVRFHPQMDQKEKELVLEELSMFSKNLFDYDFASSAPLYSLLRVTDLHVTSYSSCVIEAAEFGVPSISFHSNAKDYFKKLFNDGKYVFSESDDLAEQVFNLTQKKKRLSHEVLFESMDSITNKIINSAKNI